MNKVILLGIAGVAAGFFGVTIWKAERPMDQDYREHQEQTQVVVQAQYLPPVPDLPSLVSAVEVVVVGRIVETSSFLKYNPRTVARIGDKAIPTPYSIHKFRVERYLNNAVRETRDTLRVIQYAGPYPVHMNVVAEHKFPLLEAGERYMLFLLRIPRTVEGYKEVRVGDYGIHGIDGVLHIQDGQVLPLQDWTPIAQMLETQQMSEEELVDVVTQAVEQAAPHADQ